jgi:uncharacterized protein with FMN-binding domain
MRKTLIAFAATALALTVLLLGKRPAAATPTGTVRTVGDTVVATGPAFSITHGVVQVQATIKAGKIVSVKPLSLPHDNNDSWTYSNRAARVLDSEVVSKQSAALDTVSGATYTSRAYLKSLQAALDAAGLKSMATAVPSPSDSAQTT